MSSRPPRLIEKPSIETVADYFREGKKRLKKAIDTYVDLPPWDALIAWHRDHRADKIRGKSARKYFEEDARVLQLVLRHRHGRTDLEALLARLKSEIDGRRGRPPKYGAGKKVRDVTEIEAIALFRELKRHALEELYMTDVIASLFVLVASHSGLRPKEMVGARLVGPTLFLRNAKRKPGHMDARGLDLSRLPQDVLTAIELLILLVPEFPSQATYKAWAKNLAEALARACKRAGIRRLSLYSFRHLALATWKRAGLSGQEIAVLAGHLSERSARHYAGARYGLDRSRIVMPASIEPAVQCFRGASPSAETVSVELAVAAATSDNGTLWEDPPTPRYKVKIEPAALPHDAVFEHFEGLAKRAEPIKPLPKSFHFSADESPDRDVKGGRRPPRKR